MNKTKIRSIVIGAVTFCLTFLVLYGAYKTFGKIYKYSIDPVTCDRLFDCAPAEFFDREFAFYSETGDLRKRAYINENEYLVIRLTPRQEKAWRESEWLSPFREIENKPEIELSEDMKNLTVYYSSDSSKIEKAEVTEVVNRVLVRIHFINLFYHRSEQESHVVYMEKNRDTGEVMHTMDLPLGHMVIPEDEMP